VQFALERIGRCGCGAPGKKMLRYSIAISNNVGDSDLMPEFPMFSETNKILQDLAAQHYTTSSSHDRRFSILVSSFPLLEMNRQFIYISPRRPV
jgi:hypothetical protein